MCIRRPNGRRAARKNIVANRAFVCGGASAHILTREHTSLSFRFVSSPLSH